MRFFKLSAAVFACAALPGCITFTPLINGGGAVPSGANGDGRIMYIRTNANGHNELWQQDMSYFNIDGPHTKVDTSYVSSTDLRYPKYSKNGWFLTFVAKNTAGSGYDEIVLADYDGALIWRGRHTSSGCKDIKYPEIMTVAPPNVDNNMESSVRISAICADSWSARSSITWEIAGLPQSGAGFPTVSEVPKLYDNIRYEARPTESTTSYTPVSTGSFHFGHPFQVIYSHNGSITWDMSLGTTHYDQVCDFVSWGGTHTGPVYINPAQYVQAGHSAAPSGNMMTLEKGYAPSISADGLRVLFNSEVYKSVPSRGEELFVFDLPPHTPWCAGFREQFPGIGTPAFMSSISELTNAAGNEYASFAVDSGYRYIMWRHEDPSNAGGSSLYKGFVAAPPPGTSPAPVRLHPGETANEFEATYFAG